MPLLRLLPHFCQLCPRCPPSTRPLSSTLCLRTRQSNYYELLGICPDASMKDIKRAFFAKSKELHPDRDPKNPALHNRFVELNEAYRILSKESSRRDYDNQLHLRGSMSPSCHTSQSPSQSSGPASASASSSWSSADARYWAQFHRARPEDYPGARQRQQRQNHRVLGYCLLLMLGSMVVHYIAFRKLEKVHRSFMDEKDRVIMAVYNESRARARSLPPPEEEEPEREGRSHRPWGSLARWEQSPVAAGDRAKIKGRRSPRPTPARVSLANSARLQEERLQKPQSPQPHPGK